MLDEFTKARIRRVSGKLGVKRTITIDPIYTDDLFVARDLIRIINEIEGRDKPRLVAIDGELCGEVE